MSDAGADRDKRASVPTFRRRHGHPPGHVLGLVCMMQALLTLAGCALLGSAPGVSPVAGVVPERLGLGPVALSRAEMGTLRILIVWPRRDLPNFKAQVIPLRTRSIRLTTRNGAGTTVDSRVLPRLPGVGEASASVFLAPGDGYTIIAEAFVDTVPDEQAAPIARGTAANVPIRKGKIVQVPITLTATYAPAITGLAPGTGEFGSEVTITGTNFGAALDLDFFVTFAGIQAAATRSGDTQAVAIVPVGPSGNVVVTVDGVPSTSVAPFAVTSGLLEALLESFDIFEHTGLLVDVGSATPVPGSVPAGGGLATTVGAAAATAPLAGGALAASVEAAAATATPPGGALAASVEAAAATATPPGGALVASVEAAVATATSSASQNEGTISVILE